ncbi:hypothetical protein JYU10_00765 [bacterium AH-315-J04]|nr:hypothetical protein [bacterium AH-315-J04]
MDQSPQNTDRTTSAAKDIDPIIGNAPEVQQAFAEAQDGKATETERPVEDQRTTSVAKQVEPVHGTSLDNAPNVRDSFAAAHGNTPANTNEQDQGSGSQMVKDDKPNFQPSNNMPEKKIVDREAFDQKWDQEKDRAAASQEAIKAALETIRDMEPELGMNRNNGMEM